MPETTVSLSHVLCLPCTTAAWRHSFEKDPLQHLRKERQGRAREGGQGGERGGAREGGQGGERGGARDGVKSLSD